MDGREPKSMISQQGKLTYPLIKLLSSAFGFSENSLEHTTWQPVKEVNSAGSVAMTLGNLVTYLKSKDGGYADDDYLNWLELTSHEQTHRDEIDNSISYWTWYAGYGIASLNGYYDNIYEKRAYANGLGDNSQAQKLFKMYGKEIISTFENSELNVFQQASRLEIIGLTYKLNTAKKELQRILKENPYLSHGADKAYGEKNDEIKATKEQLEDAYKNNKELGDNYSAPQNEDTEGKK
jgi:hypothetical protein